MKKIIYAVSLLLGLASCSFLETDTYDYLNENTLYRNESSCFAGLSGVYNFLGANGTYALNLWGDLDSGTDIMVFNRAYGKDNIQLASNNYNNTDGSLKTSWGDLYKGIHCANDYIALIQSRTAAECGSEQKQKMFVAEAKAIRALCYMNLVAFWGEVPLRLTVTSDLTQQLKKKSPQSEVYAQIIKDLTEALDGCRPADELNSPGRISETTVKALLARTYMWQSGYPVYANTWDKALEYAREVRDSKLHELYKASDGTDGYRSLFINMCSNKYDLAHRESMFEIEFYGNGLDKSNESGKVGLYVGISQGVQTDPDVAFAYAWHDGSKILFRMYEDTDLRKWWNFGDYQWVTVNGKVVKRMLTDDEKAKREDGNPGKWRAEYDPVRPWARNNSSINYPVMRYADVLLMIAECANEVSNTPTQEAIDAVNLIRERAGVSKVKLGDYTVGEFRQFIFEERTRELCFEVPRRMELRRKGKEFYFDRIRLLQNQGKDEFGKVIGYTPGNVKRICADNLGVKHLYFPIPQTELNTNTICGQAENW